MRGMIQETENMLNYLSVHDLSIHFVGLKVDANSGWAARGLTGEQGNTLGVFLRRSTMSQSLFSPFPVFFLNFPEGSSLNAGQHKIELGEVLIVASELPVLLPYNVLWGFE